jgi:hypothetical protein
MKKCIVFACYKTQRYNPSHANKCVDVEHENKSLDYRPLMNAVNPLRGKLTIDVNECQGTQVHLAKCE